jgi:hypothetical protein
MKHFKTVIVFSVLLSFLYCNPFQKDDNKDKNRNNLLLGLALASASNPQASLLNCNSDFNGFACIPDSLTVTSKSTRNLSKNTVVNDPKYEKMPEVYQPVRNNFKLNREIMNSIAKLVKALREVNVSGTITGSGDWSNQPAKYKYSPSTKRPGGKHLEVWFNNAPTPFANNKAFEMNFIDGGESGLIEGQVWSQILNNDNTLAKIYVEFSYNGATKARKSGVVINGFISNALTNQKDNAHFYIEEGNGLAKLDGGFSLSNFSPGSIANTPITPVDRAYLYSAVGSAEKAAVSVAFPLATNSTTTVFQNEDVANISEVWTDWLLFGLNGSGNLSTVNSVCTGSLALSSPSSANPSSPSGSSASNLKACFDKILQANPNSDIKNSYYIAAVKNPAFYSLSGTTAILESIENAPDPSYALIQAAIRNTVRNGDPGDGYNANFTASAIKSIDLINGTGLQARHQWGDGGTGVNSTNGSSYNLAGF